MVTIKYQELEIYKYFVFYFLIIGNIDGGLKMSFFLTFFIWVRVFIY